MFKQIFDHLQGSGISLNMTITIVNDKITASVKFQPVKKDKKDSAFDNLAPVIITGTPEEFDAEFIDLLKAPIKRVSNGIHIDIEKFDESLEKAIEEEKPKPKKETVAKKKAREAKAKREAKDAEKGKKDTNAKAPTASDSVLAIDAAKALAEQAKRDFNPELYKKAWEQLQKDLKEKKFSKAEIATAEQLIFDLKKSKMMAEADLENASEDQEPVTDSDDITIPATEKKKPVVTNSDAERKAKYDALQGLDDDAPMSDTPMAEQLDENLSDMEETVEPEIEEDVDDDF